MSHMDRPCPDCGEQRSFACLHDEAEVCPDSPGGHCPEWYCTECGAALLTGFPPAVWEPEVMAVMPGKVA